MKISLVIAAYNVEQYIEKCIYSCAQQDIPMMNYEIIVVNDGSTDDTATIIDGLQLQIPNLRVIHQENKGLGGSRNTGIINAKGEYIWFIDGDDYIQENCLSAIINNISKYNLDAQVLNYNVVDETGKNLIEKANSVLLVETIVDGGTYYRTNYQKSYSWLFIYKRDIFVNNYIFFQERINMQDSEIQPRLLMYTYRLSFLNKTCYYYRQQADSFTNSSNSTKRHNYFRSIISVRNSFEDLLKQYPEINTNLAEGLRLKIKVMHQIVYTHLLYYNYSVKWLKKNIQLLRENRFYPLQYQSPGVHGIILKGFNTYPVLTKYFLQYALKLKNLLK